MRRASVSIAANIAEGTKRVSGKDKIRFNTIADGSLEEVKYCIILGYDLGYMSEGTGRLLMEQAREIGRMLFGFSKSIQQ